MHNQIEQSKDMKRNSKSTNQKQLTILNKRYDRLLELNQIHHYTFMVLDASGKLVPNPKEDKYTNLLLRIRAEKQRLWNEIRKENPKYSENVNNGIKALVSLTKADMFNLTSPIV